MDGKDVPDCTGADVSCLACGGTADGMRAVEETA
jgi:hypothetical protein